MIKSAFFILSSSFVRNVTINYRIITSYKNFFVVINTYFIGKDFWVGVLICGFLISFIWSFNVKKVAFGTIKDRIIYSLGACVGSGTGLLLSKIVIE